MLNDEKRKDLGLKPKQSHNGNRYKNEKPDCIAFYICLAVVVVISIIHLFY